MAANNAERESYQMPEDPPQFGDDGLQYLNQSQVDHQMGDDMKKDPASQADPSLNGVPMTDDERRAQHVWNRRHPTNPFQKFFQKIIPYGSIASSGVNLASSTLGAGIIGLPCAFQRTGISMAIIYLCVFAVQTIYSITLLTMVAQQTGLRTWSDLAYKLLGLPAFCFLFFVIWFLCFGGDVSYIISLENVFDAFLSNSKSASDYWKSENGARLVTSITWFVVILPLCLLREINSLRVVSFVAVFFIVFFVICIVIDSCRYLHRNGVRDDLVAFQTGNYAVTGLGLFMFSFIAQVNTFEVLGEMYKPSVRRMTYSATFGVMLCFTLYFMAGFFGYMRFGETVPGSVLVKYNPVENYLMAVSYAGIILKLCVGFALHLIPCRDVFFFVFRIKPREAKFWQIAIISGGQAGAALVGGLFIPRVTTVFGILGSFCGGYVGFIFPSLFIMYAGGFTREKVGWPMYLATYFLLITGVIGVVFGTTATIYGEVDSWSDS